MFLKKFKNIFCLTQTKMFDEQFFVARLNGQTFCLSSKIEIFDKKCLIVWPGPYKQKIFENVSQGGQTLKHFSCQANIFVIIKLQQLATLQHLATFLSNKASVYAHLAITSLFRNVGRAMFLDVVKRSNNLLEKQISNV